MQAAPIVAEACALFSCLPRSVLDLPASQLFTVLRANREIQRSDRRDQVWIASVAAGDSKWMETVLGRFRSPDGWMEGPTIDERANPTGRTPGPVPELQAGSREAWHALKAVFDQKKRGEGHGG